MNLLVLVTSLLLAAYVWTVRFQPIEPDCRSNQTRLGATLAEAARTCACAVRGIVSLSPRFVGPRNAVVDPFE
jgi:hypothetical protein